MNKYQFIQTGDKIIDSLTGRAYIVDSIVGNEIVGITKEGDARKIFELQSGGKTWLFPLSFYEL